MCGTFKLSKAGTFIVVLLRSIVSISISVLPLPNNVNVDRGLFSVVFRPIFKDALLVPKVVLDEKLKCCARLLVDTVFAVITGFAVKEGLEGGTWVGKRLF